MLASWQSRGKATGRVSIFEEKAKAAQTIVNNTSYRASRPEGYHERHRPMTRRGAIIGAMLMAGGNLTAQRNSTFVSQAKWPDWTPDRLIFAFGTPHGFSSLEVRFGDGSSVVLTEADLKRELQPPAPRDRKEQP
jgi:hypothetical protein